MLSSSYTEVTTAASSLIYVALEFSWFFTLRFYPFVRDQLARALVGTEFNFSLFCLLQIKKRRDILSLSTEGDQVGIQFIWLSQEQVQG